MRHLRSGGPALGLSVNRDEFVRIAIKENRAHPTKGALRGSPIRDGLDFFLRVVAP
jgi:hypothetical protein